MTTWLKGLTTWANLTDDLVKLACAEITDGAGNTPSTTDRWVREVAGQNSMRSNDSSKKNISGMSNRMGYWSQFGSYSIGSDDWHGALGDFCRTSAVHTSGPSGGTIPRWDIVIAVATGNSVAFNYSTASLRFSIHNANTGASVSSGTVSPNAAGVASISSNGLQVTVGNPTTGFLSVGHWARQFDLTFMGGIDWFGPMAQQMVPGTFSFTTAISGSGSQPGDWDIANYATQADVFNQPNGAGNTFYHPRGGYGHGVGIKTNTACTGNLYTMSWDVSLHKLYFQAQSGANNGQIRAFWQGDIALESGGSYPVRGGITLSQFLRPFQTPGSVVAGAAVQYWMAVGPESLMIAVNGDPLNTGKLSFNLVGTFDPLYPTYDKFPQFIGQNAGTSGDFTGDLTSSSTRGFQRWRLWDQKKRQDNSENRDWQTGWLRTDFNIVGLNTSPSGSGTAQSGNFGYDLSVSGGREIMIHPGSRWASASYIADAVIYQQEKPSDFDGKWMLQELMMADYGQELGSGASTSGTQDSSRTFRGYIKDVFFCSDSGWSSGDELLDTDTGDQFFLVKPDYLGFYLRMRVNNNDYRGGIAFLESA